MIINENRRTLFAFVAALIAATIGAWGTATILSGTSSTGASTSSASPEASTSTTIRSAKVSSADPLTNLDDQVALVILRDAQAKAEAEQAAKNAQRARRSTTTVISRRSATSRAGSTPVAGGDVWARLAQCESGMRNVNTGNGYYGYFQFSAATWRSVGMSGLPHHYDYGTQLAAAQRLQARSGWGQWPACSRKLGLR